MSCVSGMVPAQGHMRSRIGCHRVAGRSSEPVSEEIKGKCLGHSPGGVGVSVSEMVIKYQGYRVRIMGFQRVQCVSVCDRVPGSRVGATGSRGTRVGSYTCTYLYYTLIVMSCDFSEVQ